MGDKDSRSGSPLSGEAVVEEIKASPRAAALLGADDYERMIQWKVGRYLETMFDRTGLGSESGLEKMGSTISTCFKIVARGKPHQLTMPLVLPFMRTFVLTLGGIDEHWSSSMHDMMYRPSEDEFATLVAKVLGAYMRATGIMDIGEEETQDV